jgi:septal ring factor EnvC (AmiA/AmiB activator)
VGDFARMDGEIIMTIDSEIKDILNDHKEEIEKIDTKVEKQGEKIQQLEINITRNDQRLLNIENGLLDMKNSYLQGNALVLQILQSQTDVQKNKDNNITDRIKKIIAALAALGTAYFAGNKFG